MTKFKCQQCNKEFELDTVFKYEVCPACRGNLFPVDYVKPIDYKEEYLKLRVEFETLRFKERQEQRFIWWVWNVYGKNVQELLIQTHKVLLIHTDSFWSLVRNLTDYTEHIYDGTYLDVEISTDAKEFECAWAEESDPEIALWNTACGQKFYLQDGTPSDNYMKYCCYCGKKLVEK